LLKYRSQRLALIISVLIHLLILFIYRPLAQINEFPDQSEAAHAETEKPLVFELVETPEDAIQQRPDAATLLSDKNALERDEYRDDDITRGEAYSEGYIPYRVFAGQSGPAGEAQALSQMLKTKQPQVDSYDQLRNLNLDRSIEDFDSQQRQIPPTELKNYLQLHTGHDRPAAQRQFIDDIDYDQRRSSAGNLGGISLNTYAWDFAFYILEMKKKLKANTYPPAAFTQLGMISGETVLKFKVLPDGRVTDITVIEYKGDQSLMETSLDAVKIASPFGPLPRDFPEEYLELKWTFVYSVYR
jgi:TonB family protein